MARPKRKPAEGKTAPSKRRRSAEVVDLRPKAKASEPAPAEADDPPWDEPEAAPEPKPQPKPKASSGAVKVRWTKLGERKRAWSEHGTHKVGEVVETEHAEMLIARGYAEPA